MTRLKSNAEQADRVPLAGSLPLASPFTLYVFPSNACNFRCSYCAHSLSDGELFQTYGVGSEMMSLDTMRLIVEQSANFAPYKLLQFVSQGEPLLNRDLPQMIKMAASAGIAKRIEIITNASLLTREYSDALIDSGLTNLRVSLQGLDKETYRRICGIALDFDTLLEHLAYFYQHKKPEMGLFVKIMDIALPPVGVTPNAAAEFYKLLNGKCDRMSVEYVQPVYHAVGVQQNAVLRDRYGNEHSPRFVCPFPFYQMCIWPNGDIQPCDAIYRACSLGNVHGATLREIWNGERLRDFRLAQLRDGYKSLPKCENCCAPDDCSSPLDVLDGERERLINLFS
ncbi:MAG: radical SAM protein [Clostridiales bacterium]|jgi:radical SAM protein with 4Fe4S-binding SPASM domain|nr:radical SAM protein [Clostridiales bacterium]